MVSETHSRLVLSTDNPLPETCTAGTARGDRARGSRRIALVVPIGRGNVALHCAPLTSHQLKGLGEC